MAAMVAASHPERVSALILVNSFARWRRADDYPIGMPEATTEKLLERWEQNWGVTSEILDLTAPSVANDARFRSWWLRYSRLTMPRHASATMYRWVTEIDIRSILPSIRVPTLVLHRSGNRTSPRRLRPLPRRPHSRRRSTSSFLAPTRFRSIRANYSPLLDEVEEFLTGTRSSPLLDRRLATMLFTDVVDSTRMRGGARRQRLGQAREVARRHRPSAPEHVPRAGGRAMPATGFSRSSTGLLAPSRAPLASSRRSASSA